MGDQDDFLPSSSCATNAGAKKSVGGAHDWKLFKQLSALHRRALAAPK